MRPSTRLFHATGVAILTSLMAAAPVLSQTATTTPVGFITVTVPAAVDPSTPAAAALSIPLYRTADFIGAVATIDSANQFTLTGAAFTAGQFADPAAPRLVRVKTSATAAHVGKFFLVTANTANQLTVDLTGTGVANISDALTAGANPDTVEIVAANTLGSVFGNATTPPALAAGATAGAADNVLLWNGGTGAWDTYFWTGSVGTPNNIWKRIGNVDRSNTVIYPEDGVFVIHRSTSASVAITFLGTVPSTAEQSGIDANGSTFLANRFPTDTTLGALGLQNIPGWVAGNTASSSDNVYIWNSALGLWDTYYWTGTVGTPNNIWKRIGNIDRSSTPIPAGTAVYLIHSGASLNLAQNLPYTP
jgi:uncharacterized protein (TIGR02597 family)